MLALVHDGTELAEGGKRVQLEELRSINHRAIHCRELLGDGVEGAPRLDEAAEGVVGDEDFRDRQEFSRHGASAPAAGEDPVLNAVPVVGDAGGESHRILHQLQRYRTQKIGWHFHSLHVNGT